MDSLGEKLKTIKTNSNIQNTNRKGIKKPLKTEVQIKKRQKRTAKFKSGDSISEKTEGEQSSKKRKVQTEGEQSSKKRKVQTEGEQSSKKRKVQTEPGKKSKKKVQNIDEPACKWSDEEYLADSEGLSLGIARNIIHLFKQENTIPFIARYRGHLLGDLTPEKLRKIKATYEYIQLIHLKAEQLIRQLVASNSAQPELISHIQSVRNLEELEFIGSSFKKDSRSLAERARQLGLEPPAVLLLQGQGKVVLEDLVNPESGLEDTNKVKSGIQHIIADIICKNTEVHGFLEPLYSSDKILFKSKFKNGISEDDKSVSKYSLYGDFSQSPNLMQPHQTLAINRGESEKQLTVKIVIPDFLWQPLKTFCREKWLKWGSNYELRTRLFNASVDDGIKRLLEPLVCRKIRANLTAEAENESLAIFELNLRQLLMTPPYSGHVVMGIDPGFGNGCKVAVVSHTGEPVCYDVFYLNKKVESKNKLRNLVRKYSCETIALGNGKGSRETEALLDECIKKGFFKPLDVSYTIIDEQGVSIYSCSSNASEEFPTLNPKIVGAISIARRLQNPLSELVKVEPKHLGVGMYQHDMNKKKLESALDEVVSECVSFVGVDINSASLYLLKRVAGLNASKAQEIIKYRTEICSFKCREDLKKVKGIKTKTFQQCAGFIRVIPSTARCTKHISCEMNFNPLDETWIHPESYEIALKIIQSFGLNVHDLGTEKFVKTVEEETKWKTPEKLAKDLNCSSLEILLVTDSLQKPKNFDMRCLSDRPIFRKEIINLEDLSCGDLLDGVVRNIVTFGAFVDVGVSVSGLIHKSQMQNKYLHVNDRVKVQVLSTNHHNKIELKLLSVST